MHRSQPVGQAKWRQSFRERVPRTRASFRKILDSALIDVVRKQKPVQQLLECAARAVEPDTDAALDIRLLLGLLDADDAEILRQHFFEGHNVRARSRGCCRTRVGRPCLGEWSHVCGAHGIGSPRCCGSTGCRGCAPWRRSR